jgi:hypothetical protein
LPAVQSESTTQSPRQEFAPQVYGSQETSCSAGQAPAPLQDAAITATPEEHDPLRQLVSAAGYAHAFECTPSHVPPHTVPSLRQSVRALRGVPATGVHVPALPGSAHASHWPLQAFWQQTPSTQNPVPH